MTTVLLGIVALDNMTTKAVHHVSVRNARSPSQGKEDVRPRQGKTTVEDVRGLAMDGLNDDGVGRQRGQKGRPLN